MQVGSTRHWVLRAAWGKRALTHPVLAEVEQLYHVFTSITKDSKAWLVL